jgi:glucoamylase
LPYLQAMAAMVGRCGMIPEQVWDEASSPRPSLALGKPSGSAMPLVWAHAEFVKLAASRALGRPFDRPEAVWRRYGGRRPAPAEALWSPRAPIAQMRAGQGLWLCLPRPARVHHGVDGWQATAESDTAENGLGQHVLALPTSGLAAGTRIDFTFFWPDSGSWEGRDHRIDVC